MSLSLTTRRKQQTSTAKWSTQQHQVQPHNSDIIPVTSANILRHHHHSNYLHQALRKQKSFTENLQLNKSFVTAHTGRAYLTRGLSIGRSYDIKRTSFPQKVLKKHSSISAQRCNGKNERETLKIEDLMKGSITATSEQRGSGRSSDEFLRNSHRVQAWSSTSSILKCLDKEVAQLNRVVEKCNDVKYVKDSPHAEHNAKVNSKTSCLANSGTQSSHLSRKEIKSDANKVNLNIILSHVASSREENDYISTDRELDDEDSDDVSTNSKKGLNLSPKMNNTKKHENSSNSAKISSAIRPNITAQQRRSLYHTSRLATNFGLTSNTVASNCDAQIPNPCSALTVQKRPPLVRAMSAPVRTLDEMPKGCSTSFFNNKRKSRRRKLNTRNKSYDKDSCDLLTAKELKIDSKLTNGKYLARSKSAAPDLVTLVSLISSEGSDSEKEENSLTPSNSHIGSPNRRAPSLRKTGKSVSFQENYPPTFQLASKEYSHMLRRGSIASLTQRVKSIRPPTASPGSLFHATKKLHNVISNINGGESSEENESNLEEIKNNESTPLLEVVTDKPLEEKYEYPEYVHSLKERECWKLFMKMSTRGVTISYDTILRGMLTPTEFRQLQKQRDIEEAKVLKAVDNVSVDETAKISPTAIERLKSLLKN